MAKDPAFLFYYDRFFLGTFGMTDAQRGQFILLMCLQANKGHVTMQEMERVCKGNDPVVFSKFKEYEPGFFANDVLTVEIEKRQNHAKKQKERIENYWQKKKLEQSTELPSLYHGIDLEHTKTLPLINVNVNVNKSINKDINVPFENFYNAYQKKVGDKTKLQKKWEALTDAERLAAMEHVPRYVFSTPNKEFRKDPATYLNNKSFNDEIIFKNGNRPNNYQPQFNGQVGPTDRA